MLNRITEATGHSVATWKGQDVPFVKADFSKVKASKYYKHPDAKCRVMGMWIAYHEAYADEKRVNAARMSVEKTGARVLLIAGDEDEVWPSVHSVRKIGEQLCSVQYEKDVKTVVYPHGSHLNGLMPNRVREKKLYRMIPLIGITSSLFDEILPYLTEYYVIVCELDGHSDKEAGTFVSVTDASEKIEQYVKENLDGSLYGLLGFSLGGTIATELISRGKIKVERTILDAAFTIRMGIMTYPFKYLFQCTI